MLKSCSVPPFLPSLYLLNSKMTSNLSSFSSSSHPSSSFDPDWAWLPQNVLFMVLNKLLLLSDMIRFGSVCSHWRSVAKDRFEQLNLRNNMHFNRNVPMLLVPITENNESVCSVFNVTNNETYNLRLPVPFTKRYCGSSHGWLIILDEVSFVVTLINPFYFGNSQGIIHLPPFIAALDTFEEMGKDFICEYFVTKAILSSDPISSPNGYALMLIYGDMRMLGLWKSGDTHWTYINRYVGVVYDIIYSQGRFLAVNVYGYVYSCDIDTQPPSFSKVSGPLLGSVGNSCRRYIVELPDGTIMQIARLLKPDIFNSNMQAFVTLSFGLYKLVDNDGTSSWVSVHSLEEGAVFLGNSSTLYVSASQYPGCRPNSIYFTDDFQFYDTELLNTYRFCGRRDIGFFDLGDNRFTIFYYRQSEGDELPPPPIWINPTI